MKVILTDKEARTLAKKFGKGVDIQDIYFSDGRIDLKVKYAFFPISLGLVLNRVDKQRVVFRIDGGVARFASSIASFFGVGGHGWKIEDNNLIINVGYLLPGFRINHILIEDGSMEIDVSV